MHKYFIKTPWIFRKFFFRYIWSFKHGNNEVYLTFDDGPHATITPWVLDELKRHGAKATFFCVGKNVARHPAIYQRILGEGHAVGNHTHNHLNGWNTPAEKYLADVGEASLYIDSNLFRPPYGKIKKKQFDGLQSAMGRKVKVIMWDVLSADFDRSVSAGKCLGNVTRNTVAGSVIVFHDSEKAYPNLIYALPGSLNYLKNKGFKCARIDG